MPKMTRRSALAGLIALPGLPRGFLADIPARHALIAAARRQIGVTTRYDPAYVRLDYPDGDVPRDRGVCIDVVIRAYRDALHFDFQKAIHEDMRANFDAYPDRWGLSRPDRNIDHRRVPNLETWLVRQDAERDPSVFLPGDLVTCLVGGTLPHIGIVSDKQDRTGAWRVIHNIGLGTREDTRLWSYGPFRRFRFLPG